MAQEYVSSHYTRVLTQSGLTPAQASLYEALVQYGSLNARRASFIAGIPRTLAYKIFGELEALGLVTKNDAKGSIATFTPSNPLKLKELAERRVDEAVLAKKALDGALFKLISDFNRTSDQLGVQMERATGLIEFLEAQLVQKKPLFATVIENSPTKLTFSVVFEEDIAK